MNRLAPLAFAGVALVGCATSHAPTGTGDAAAAAQTGKQQTFLQYVLPARQYVLPARFEYVFTSTFDGTEQALLLSVPGWHNVPPADVARNSDGKEIRLLRLPPVEYRPAALAIYLHGHGGDRDQGFGTAAFGGTFRFLQMELDFRRIAYATLDYRGTASWLNEPAEADITQVIQLLKDGLRTPKVYLIGASMGGSSALAYAVRHPDLLDGVIDVCGASDIGDYHGWCRAQAQPAVLKELADAIEKSYGGTPKDKPDLYAGRSALLHADRLRMPVVLAHGENDAVIPARYSRDLRRLLEAQGTRVLYREFPGGGHDAPLSQADWPAWLDFIAAPE